MGGIYLNECFVFSLSICFFFISLTICWSSWKYPHPINIIDDGVWDLFRFLLGFRAVFFLLSPVHRLDKELGRLPFFSFFFPSVCWMLHTHTACCVQLIKIFDSAFSVLPTRPSSSFWRRREEGKKKRKTLLPSHHSPDQRDIPPRAQFVNILKTRSLTETDN